MKKFIALIDVTGREWHSVVSDEITEEVEEKLISLFADFDRLESFVLETTNGKWHFNPRNIVAISIQEAPFDPRDVS